MPIRATTKQRQQQIWASGDFSMVATAHTMVGELLCETAELRPGQRVLDVATGSGNTALAAARRGCDVVGIDFVPALLERGRERAVAERLPIDFQDGDAEDIPFPDGSFDVVLSSFGAIFAPDQEETASEMLRVCRPGGKVGMANWAPSGFLAEVMRVSAQYAPPPAEAKSPLLWGTEARLRELFRDGISWLHLTRRTMPIRFRSAQHWLDFQRLYFGPALHVMQTLDGAQQQRLVSDLRALLDRFNRSGDETMLAQGEYVEVVAVRR